MNGNGPSPRPVVLAGTVHLDFLVTAQRHPRIGETIVGTGLAHLPRGKGANQAVAAARAGCLTELVGCVGDDDAAATLRTFLRDAGVDVAYLRTVAGPAGSAFVTVAGDDNAVVVIRGADARTSPDDVRRVPLTPSTCSSASSSSTTTRSRRSSRPTSDWRPNPAEPSPPRPTLASLWRASDVVVVNEIEFEWLGATAEPASLLVRDDQAVVVTLGPGGCLVVEQVGATEIPGRCVRVVDTTAGDCFRGTMAAQLAAGRDLRAAV